MNLYPPDASAFIIIRQFTGTFFRMFIRGRSLFYRSLHGRYGCLKRRKFILDNFPNHLVRNGVIFVPKHVPNAGDATPTIFWMHGPLIGRARDG